MGYIQFMGLQRVGPNLVNWHNNGDLDIENRLMDIVREGEGGKNRKNSMDTYTLTYIK